MKGHENGLDHEHGYACPCTRTCTQTHSLQHGQQQRQGDGEGHGMSWTCWWHGHDIGIGMETSLSMSYDTQEQARTQTQSHTCQPEFQSGLASKACLKSIPCWKGIAPLLIFHPSQAYENWHEWILYKYFFNLNLGFWGEKIRDPRWWEKMNIS